MENEKRRRDKVLRLSGIFIRSDGEKMNYICTKCNIVFYSEVGIKAHYCGGNKK